MNGEARALAKLGDLHGVEDAVDRAYRQLGESSSTADISASLTVGQYCEARTAANAATAYLAVGKAEKVTEFASRALVAFDRNGMHVPQALSRLDLATAAVMGDQPDLERGCALVAEAATIAAAEQFHSVRQRAGEFLRIARPWAGTQAVRDIAELVHAHAGPSVVDNRST